MEDKQNAKKTRRSRCAAIALLLILCAVLCLILALLLAPTISDLPQMRISAEQADHIVIFLANADNNTSINLRGDKAAYQLVCGCDIECTI